MSELFLIFGIFLLLIVMHDFFFTTLSGSGAGFLSENFSILSDKVIQFFTRLFGRRTYDYQGLLVNLVILGAWLFFIWVGLYLIFSWNPQAITNSDGRIANGWERLYFTGYTISTLGIGNFKPTTPFFELLTSCFSFFGFFLPAR